MSTEEWVIAGVRVAGSLLVLRWALVGGIVAVLTDLSDLFLRSYLQLGGVSDYQSFDKWLDQVYLLAFLAVALRWAAVPKTVAVALFGFRLAGFVAFEVTGERWLLLAFPNVFEVWFLFVASLPHWRPGFAFGRRDVAVALAMLTAVKVTQEYVLHSARWLDAFSARDLVEAVRGWVG
ncbi:MAG: hypothetical protein IT303_00390 [Dehalococcoidia bacterium]|nr:hypothetical protein [Dehalococcoidia bacterium]